MAASPFHRCFDVPGDIALTADGRDLQLVSGPQKVLQSIKQRFALYQGQWRYDRSAGLPYFDEILVAGPSVELVRRRFYDLLLNTDGVISVQSLALRVDSAGGTLYVDFVVLTSAGSSVSGTLDFLSAG